jgi:hypothetical protein
LALGETALFEVALRSVESGSGVADPAIAVFDTAAVVDGSIVPVTVTVAVAPTARSPNAQLTLRVATEQEPTVAVAVMPAASTEFGNVSDTVAPDATETPSFRTMMVQVAVCPGVNVAGLAVFVTDKSADVVIVPVAVVVLSEGSGSVASERTCAPFTIDPPGAIVD